jgi:serine/threonine-protein kinase
MLRCLEKKRDARFANVGELAGALAPFGTRNAARSAERVSKVLSAAGISSSNLELQPPASVTAGTNPAWGTTQSRSSHGALWLSLGALVVAAAGGVALFLHYRSAPGTAAPQPAAVALPSSEPARVTASAPPAPTVSPSAELKATEPTAPLVAPAISASTAPSLTASAAPSPAPAKTAGRSRPVAAKGTAPKAPAAQPAASPAAKPSPPAKAAIDPLEGRH